MNRIKENLDLLAIMALLLGLGLAQVPDVRARIAELQQMEQPTHRLRMPNVERFVHTIYFAR